MKIRENYRGKNRQHKLFYLLVMTYNKKLRIFNKMDANANENEKLNVPIV